MFGPRSNIVLKKFSLLIIFICTMIIAATGIARADGNLTPYEKAIGDGVADSLCSYLDVAGVNGESMDVTVSIFLDKVPLLRSDPSNIADVVNYVVFNYCPQHWPALVAFGDGFRSGGTYA